MTFNELLTRASAVALAGWLATSPAAAHDGRNAALIGGLIAGALVAGAAAAGAQGARPAPYYYSGPHYRQGYRPYYPGPYYAPQPDYRCGYYPYPPCRY